MFSNNADQYSQPYYNYGVGNSPTTPNNSEQALMHLYNISSGQGNTNALLLDIAQSLKNLYVTMGTNQVLKEQSVIEREEAFSRIEETAQGLCVNGKTNFPHVVCPVHIDMIFRIKMDPLYQLENYYIIYFTNIDKPLILSLKDINNPDTLCDAVSATTGHQVKRFGGERKVGRLLRNYINSRAKEISVPFYAGWKNADGIWTFIMLNGSTHGRIYSKLTNPAKFTNREATTIELPSATTNLTMVQQVTRLMDCIASPDIRSILFTWIHAAALYSLLNELGYTIPLGICLYSADPQVMRALEAVMSWYGDIPIPLELPAKDFRFQIIARKDQPVLVRDSAVKSGNSEILLNALETGAIPGDRSGTSYPLQALPTIITSQLSNFCFSPQFILLEISSDDLENNSLAQLTQLQKYLPDYIQCYSHYVESHIEQLCWDIDMAVNSAHAYCPDDCPLSQDALFTLGIFNGIQQFVWEFHKDLAPTNELLTKLRTLSPKEPPKAFLDALIQNSAYQDSSTAIASQFCSIASSWITNGSFEMRNCRNERIAKAKLFNKGIIYLDSDYYYFPRSAFTAVCRATDNSSPTVLKALESTGILSGAKANNYTFLTRKTIIDKDGHPEVKNLYKLDQETMNEFSHSEF